MAFLQTPTRLFQVIFSHTLWLPMDPSAAVMEGYVFKWPLFDKKLITLLPNFRRDQLK